MSRAREQIENTISGYTIGPEGAAMSFTIVFASALGLDSHQSMITVIPQAFHSYKEGTK